MSVQSDTKPNGPAAAAILAAGIGTFVLGLNVTLVEAFHAAQGTTAWWDFSKRYGIGSAVGPLRGKVVVALVAYFVSWSVLGYICRRVDLNFSRIFTIALV